MGKATGRARKRATKVDTVATNQGSTKAHASGQNCEVDPEGEGSIEKLEGILERLEEMGAPGTLRQFLWRAGFI
jgi:hypothetical protein